MSEPINSARVAWMREQGAIQAQWNDAGELLAVTLGPPVPPQAEHTPFKHPENPDIVRRRMALAATASIKRTGL